MQLNNLYHKVFGKIPIFGMIHLAGSKPTKQALDEIDIFEEEGVDGAIIENYFGSILDVEQTLQETYRRNQENIKQENEKENNKQKIVIGINILPNEFGQSFKLAQQYAAEFIQLDHIAGKYISGDLNFQAYSYFKKKYNNTIVLGGVWPKYYKPVSDSNLETDLKEGMERAEAIVVTGSGTGMETPFEKIQKFRSILNKNTFNKNILNKHPLVIGAGLTPDNAYNQLCIADGAIVGTSLKLDNKTGHPVDRQRVKDFMSVVREARKYQEGKCQENISSKEKIRGI